MDFKQQMDEILLYRRINPDKELNLVKDFRQKLKTCKDMDKKELTYMQAFSDTYLCESYILHGDLNKARKIGEKAIKFQLHNTIKDLIPITYNLLGHICNGMDNYVASATHFFSGIEAASDSNDFEILRVLYLNFGMTYLNLHEYEKAKDLFDKSYSLALQSTYPEYKKAIIMQQHQEAMAAYYLGIGEYDKVLEPFSPSNPQYTYMRTQIAFKKGDTDETQSALTHYFALDPQFSNPVMQYETYRTLFHIAYEIKHQHFTRQCLDKILESAHKCNIANMWFFYYEALIQSSLLFGWEMESNVYEKFHEYHKEISEDRAKNELASFSNELHIYLGKKKQKKLEEKNERLHQLSMRDELTKVYNRIGFQKYVEELFDTTKANQISFGICMIDLDLFKNVNDKYGHLTGDECLKVVARTIRTAFGKDAIISRYGGDEFAVITSGLSNEQYEYALQKLHNHKNLKNIVNPIDDQKVVITLSIGALNCIPPEDTTSTDYLYIADKLLYDVKGKSRNDYRFKTKLR